MVMVGWGEAGGWDGRGGEMVRADGGGRVAAGED